MMSVNQEIGKRNVGQNRVGGHGGKRSPSFLCEPFLLGAATGAPYPGIIVTRVLYGYVLSSCGQGEYCTWVGRTAAL